ncbi:hypothetical protein R3P38DRAFT_3259077 [Favolaschia claudopus]|uniref:Transmembrane protein n=1 Tax=Favolaschia claudopus TaxID=2862362 RepID=A0AAW0D0Z7_9AGAR
MLHGSFLATPLFVAAVAVVGARHVLAANDSHSSNEPVIIGFILAVLFLILFSCAAQRRRARLAALAAQSTTTTTTHIPSNPPVRLSSYSRFPHGIQYGSSSPLTPHITPAGSEYPPHGAADWAPPPYVKEEGGGQQQYAPPSGPPPPTIDAPYTYAPPPGPPPRAHISSNSADFTNAGVGGFRAASPQPRSPAAP